MAALSRLRIAWNGSPVTGGGVTTWYTEGDPLQLQLAAKTFFAGTLLSACPSGLQFVVPASGETIESSTGALTGGWTAGTAQTTSATGSSGYAAGVGTRVVWNTPGITRRRRVRGSTYLVPLVVSMYDTDGTIVNSVRTNLEAAAQAVIVALGDDFCVWSRNTSGASDGAIWTISSASVPDKVSWLRSRRT
jgi:hypothetical protein